MHAIVNPIFIWSWFSELHGYPFNGFFICPSEGNLCLDPAEPTAEVLDGIARQGVARIRLTNRNHVCMANHMRLRTGARTAIHPADAAYARTQGAELDDESSGWEKK